jgi:hypothetical protein
MHKLRNLRARQAAEKHAAWPKVGSGIISLATTGVQSRKVSNVECF